MKSEFTLQAKTVEEAYAKANDIYSSLGEISIEVINPGKKGFLGIGRVPAEIKVIVDDGKPERKPAKEQKPKAENKPQKQAAPKPAAPAQKTENKQDKPQKQNAPKPAPKAENKPEVKQENKAPKQAAPAPKAIEDKIPTIEEKEEQINVTLAEKQLAVNFLTGFIRDIGFNCEVKADMTVNENGFVPRLITIEGEDAPSLIGHRGEMLDALQYLSNLCLARKSEGEHKEYVRVIIDIENYREKREATLRALARRMAAKALKYQRNVLLEPMNPYERMIIHSEVQSIEGVSTHSVGYDDNRKIVITCENKRRNNNK
ncbi:MAG: KH domain-containing protein [Clostridia bacterium]|nr:KH domain-containing protein [Clostridia bacterium]